MAKKKQEIALMREIESQEEWEDVMGKEGMWVVDVYQEWSGHCDAMVSNFRRIKNELGDDLLHFAMAKSDTIESLEKYRGSCEPCFLFFAAGVLVSYVHGANSPLILRTLTEQLAQEHKVLDGSSERKEVKDPFVAIREAAETGQDEEEEEADTGYVPHRKVSTLPQDYEEVDQGYTVAIIKPNVVADGKVDDVLAEMKARGIEVIAQEERQLTEEEAKEFYSHLKDEEYFNDLVSFMASGPSHVLVLTKGQEDDSIIKDWRDLLGPPTVEDAKEKEPESLRAKYGQAGLMNALHGSDSKDTAARELAFFFPHMSAPTMHRKKKEVQRTLALIRPDAFASNREAILERIKEAGFQIALQKEVVLTKEQAEEFYKEHAGQPYFDELTNRMSSGPLLALGLAREDAVSNWRGLLGPTDVEDAKTSAPDSLRAQFAVPDTPINQLHGSDSVESAQKELEFFFPIEQTVAMIKPDAIGTKDSIIEKIHQSGFRIAARKETNITREIAESFYEDQRDKEYFNDLVEHMISGPTMFMVLSREGAVDGWRQEIGPTDPATAKEMAPNSLRAQFGSDVLKNAVHGASTAAEAQQKIKALFGDLEFNPDGTVKGGILEEEEEQAEQQQQGEQQQPEQEARAEEQAEQQAEQPTEAEGKAEGEGQSEEKPTEEEGEAAEKKEGEVEEKPSEQVADTTEKDKDESAEKKEGEVEEKPSEQVADTTEKDKDESAEKAEGGADEKPTEKAADSAEKETAEKETAEKDEDAGQAAQQQGDESNNAKEEQKEAKAEEQKEAKAEEQKEEAKTEEQKEEAKVEEQKEEAKTEEQKEEAKVEEQKEAKDTKAEDQKEEAKDTKAEEQKEMEEQKDGQKEEESKVEQKTEGAAEAKKEGEEAKTEA